MENSSRERMNAFFDESIAACKAREVELFADERKDESVFERVRANVFDIFKTVMNAGFTASGGDGQKARAFFASRLESIPRSWGVAKEKLNACGETEKALIEQIKLDAVGEIENALLRIWSDEK